ncbi:MAG: Zn-dependent exopeptidase M28 [Fermentimonas caenicola]|nr:MAG: Zn-dependent exopeptidase M28 [Fermentimonas caenicola]
MEKAYLVERIKTHLHVLCNEIGERRVGSEKNRLATDYAGKILKEYGWQTEANKLSVIDWKTEGAELTCGDKSFEVFSSHYSLGCSVKGELIAIDTIDKLEQSNITDKIVLLYGDISSQQIAPKKFPFWNPEEHQHLISVLERNRPLAIITATKRDSALAGGVYPFPMFEDGDFDIPSVYMTDIVGEKLLKCKGETVELVSKAKRIPEIAYNIIGNNSTENSNRIVITAHIDTKIDTPGAIDNGTGVAVLLVLAEILKDCSIKHPIELVVFNGEDYYGAPGQVEYVKQNSGKFSDILLNINIDGAGYHEGFSCFSPFNLPENVSTAFKDMLSDNPLIIEGLPWYQGDHSLFLQNRTPAIAVSSNWFIENMESQEITHTPKDNLGIVNFERVAECAIGVRDLIRKIGS